MFSRVIKAILRINPNAEVSIKDDDIDTLRWHNGTTPIAKSDIEAELVNVPTFEEEQTAKENLKASAKAKLMAGEALTEDEANVMIGG